MSLDVDGFDEPVAGDSVTIAISNDHRLMKLAQKLPWEEMLKLVLPDLQRTDRKHWWMGRPLRIRIHLGVYILQQMFNLTDRATEQQVRDNAAFQLFCGYGLIK
ncbi:transposase, partial [Legionella jordanis]